MSSLSRSRSPQFAPAGEYQNRLPDIWTKVRDRFLEDLSDKEKVLYCQATPSTVLDEVLTLNIHHAEHSKSRWVLGKMQSTVELFERYGKAIDVYVNAQPLVMSPLWGSIRILLIVSPRSAPWAQPRRKKHH